MTSIAAHWPRRRLHEASRGARLVRPRESCGSARASAAAGAVGRAAARRSGGRRALAYLAGEAAPEVVEAAIERAGGDVVDLGVLVDQQRGGVGFAAGGEPGVVHPAEQRVDAVADGVEVFDDLDVGAEFVEAEAAREDVRVVFGDVERLADEAAALVAKTRIAARSSGLRSIRKGRLAARATRVALASSRCSAVKWVLMRLLDMDFLLSESKGSGNNVQAGELKEKSGRCVNFAARFSPPVSRPYWANNGSDRGCASLARSQAYSSGGFGSCVTPHLYRRYEKKCGKYWQQDSRGNDAKQLPADKCANQ